MSTTELVPAMDGAVATGFDYASVDEGTRGWLLEQAGEIRERERQSLEAARQSLVAAADIGRRLVEARKRLNFAKMVGWAEMEFGYKQSMVANLMKLSTRYGALVDSNMLESAAISPRAMYRLGQNNLDAEVRERLDFATVVAWAGTEFGYKESMVVSLMKLSRRYGALINTNALVSPAIGVGAMIELGRDNIDAEVRRELLAERYGHLVDVNALTADANASSADPVGA